MGRITTLLSGGLKALRSNWQTVALIVAAIWVFSTIMSIGERLGTLTEETKSNGREMTLIRGQLTDLKDVSDQMLTITKQQLALTQKLDADYAKWKSSNDELTEKRIGDVSNGTLRMSVRKPVTGTTHPVPYPANTRQ